MQKSLDGLPQGVMLTIRHAGRSRSEQSRKQSLNAAVQARPSRAKRGRDVACNRLLDAVIPGAPECRQAITKPNPSEIMAQPRMICGREHLWIIQGARGDTNLGRLFGVFVG